MIPFIKAHAYGNDFLYVRGTDAGEVPRGELARRLCDRHAGIGADGLVFYVPTADGASMQLFNADGSRSEVSGNGVRGLAALVLRDDPAVDRRVVIETDAGAKVLTRTGRDGSRQQFVAAMGLPRDLREVPAEAAGESLRLCVMDFGNPQCVVLGPLPDETRFAKLGPALERHDLFPARTNVEFAWVERPERVRILHLGARGRSDAVVGDRIVRIAHRGRGVWWCVARRRGRRARWKPAGRMARRQRVPDRMGGSALRGQMGRVGRVGLVGQVGRISYVGSEREASAERSVQILQSDPRRRRDPGGVAASRSFATACKRGIALFNSSTTSR